MALEDYIYTYKKYLQDRGLNDLRKVTIDAGFTCPNLDGSKGVGGCIYCDNAAFSPAAALTQQKVTTQSQSAIEADVGQATVAACSTPETISQQIERHIGFLKKRYKAQRFVAYFQPYSNTYADVATLERLYREAMAHPEIEGLAIATRPDCLGQDVVDLLDKIAGEIPLTLEIGVQTSHDRTLKRIGRGHSFGDYEAAMDRCHGKRFEICPHMIIGLPGEHEADAVATIQQMNRWRYHCIKITPLYTVRGTAYHRLIEKGVHCELTREAYINTLVKVLEHVPENVAIQRYCGSAPRAYFEGPFWCRDGRRVAEALEDAFVTRASRQGTSQQINVMHAGGKSYDNTHSSHIL